MIARVLAGCIHEHVGERPLCDWHVEDLQMGNMVCGNCKKADGHTCKLHLISPTLPGRACRTREKAS
jgi:hypothetical protein